jgi:hypothetical protein
MSDMMGLSSPVLTGDVAYWFTFDNSVAHDVVERAPVAP